MDDETPTAAPPTLVGRLLDLALWCRAHGVAEDEWMTAYVQAYNGSSELFVHHAAFLRIVGDATVRLERCWRNGGCARG